MHTPAPWILGDEANPLIFADGAYVAQVLMYSDGETGSLRPTAAADARLIAASPALVEALQTILRSLEFEQQMYGQHDPRRSTIDFPRAISIARAALTKALGE